MSEDVREAIRVFSTFKRAPGEDRILYLDPKVTAPDGELLYFGFGRTRAMARQGTKQKDLIDANGNPSGGYVQGKGISIQWQDGPLGAHSPGCQPGAGVPCNPEFCGRVEPNGAFVEDVIHAARQRLAFYNYANGGKFACKENSEAIDHLDAALSACEQRTRGRVYRGVDGTHEA